MRSVASALTAVCLAAVLAAVVVRDWERQAEFTPEEVRLILLHSPLPALPPDPTNRVADEPAAARLGQKAFFDTRLSADGRIACATCHDPARGWSNGKRNGEGLGATSRHVPALWNVAYNRWYFWDGRADSLWAQALQPIEAAQEMGGDRLGIAHTLVAAPDLRQAYEAVFGLLPDLSRLPPRGKPVPGDPGHPLAAAWRSVPRGRQIEVNRVFTNLGKALAAYERRIVSRNAPFDVFAAGLREGNREKTNALSPVAKRGLKLFVGKGNCILCHSGPNFTDGEFHNLRLPEDTSEPPDSGRYEGTEKLLGDEFNSIGRYSDDPRQKKTKFLAARAESWGQFKTPSLRNVAQTAPYTHDGVFASLEEVVNFYSTLKDAAPIGHHDESILKPVRFTEGESRDLIAFLVSLNGEPLAPDLLHPLKNVENPLPAPQRGASQKSGPAVPPAPATRRGHRMDFPESTVFVELMENVSTTLQEGARHEENQDL